MAVAIADDDVDDVDLSAAVPMGFSSSASMMASVAASKSSSSSFSSSCTEVRYSGRKVNDDDSDPVRSCWWLGAMSEEEEEEGWIVAGAGAGAGAGGVGVACCRQPLSECGVLPVSEDGQDLVVLSAEEEEALV